MPAPEAATSRYIRELQPNDRIVATVENTAECVELEAGGASVRIKEPIELTITLVEKKGKARARLLIEAANDVRLEHIPAKAAMVRRKRPRAAHPPTRD